MGEITRDEIKWSKFLERQQKKIADNLKELFLLHLKFKNLKDTYGLTKDNFQIHFNDPSNYKSQMDQMLLETRINNYMHLSNEEGFSKFFLMKHYLNWDEETIKENAEGIKKDKELGLVSKDGMGF
jgi:CRISPR/Cas system-associated endonuclease/helicase Cas3